MLWHISLTDGDILDGGSQIYYERVVWTASGTSDYITLQNCTIDASISVNGSYTYSGSYPSFSYGSTSAWAVYSGSVYRKSCTANVYMLYEDDVALTPVTGTPAEYLPVNLRNNRTISIIGPQIQERQAHII